ncbi:MAG TPA: hypothetical protein VGZ01_09880 [Trinickia sp.]|nr:hypothetical protein [Trinickia sp.]
MTRGALAADEAAAPSPTRVEPAVAAAALAEFAALVAFAALAAFDALTSATELPAFTALAMLAAGAGAAAAVAASVVDAPLPAALRAVNALDAASGAPLGAD